MPNKHERLMLCFKKLLKNIIIIIVICFLLFSYRSLRSIYLANHFRKICSILKTFDYILFIYYKITGVGLSCKGFPQTLAPVIYIRTCTSVYRSNNKPFCGVYSDNNLIVCTWSGFGSLPGGGQYFVVHKHT